MPLDKLNVLNWKNTDLNWQKRLKQTIDERLATLLNDSKIKKYHKKWESRIKFIDDDAKERIIEAAKIIPIEIRDDWEWNTIFEINLWWEKYSIKVVNTKKHAEPDPTYWWGKSPHRKYSKEIYGDHIRWKDINKWRDKKIATYIKKQEEKWFVRPSKEMVRDLLQKLWEKANLNKDSDEIAMLMYLLGIEWDYWLLQEWENSLSQLECWFDGRRAMGGGCWGMAQGKIILISKN